MLLRQHTMLNQQGDSVAQHFRRLNGHHVVIRFDTPIAVLGHLTVEVLQLRFSQQVEVCAAVYHGGY